MPGTRSGEYAHLAARPDGSVSAARVARFHTLCAPLITSPATPARVTDPRAQPPAAKELWPNFSQPKLLLSASESFSQRTFSFDLGRERVPVTERTDHGSSAGFGALLLSALGACLPLPERAWGAGCAGVAEALRLAIPLILRFVPGTAVPGASLPGPSGEAHRGRVPAGGLPQEPDRMNGKGTGERGSRPRPRPLGVALRTLERCAAGPRGSLERKLVGISFEVASTRVAVLGRTA
ncbi:uncharacterized protein LOC113932615 [Zalophus californianus]|uniref:Uncharacterized protein LOC113932615 n=1 Tax=Zalophus californianus TaxID=9704 RepID=A0A6J2ELH0_ZALCA|nr:uncharacterized protein LOC113932615 [Zalophus californianus]